MDADKFWQALNSAQVSTALIIIAVALSYIAFKLAEIKVNKKPPKTAK